MNRQGILIVVSGFSGAGKGTIMKALTERYEGYALSVSATTRSPRPGEEDGKAYFFKSVEEFEQMIADGALLFHIASRCSIIIRNITCIFDQRTI